MAANSIRVVALATMIVFCAQFSFATSAVAQSAAPSPQPPTPYKLDLTSTNHNTTSNILSSHGPQTITEGGVQKTFSGGANLTPAERLAIYQVYSSANHTQSITLAGNGTATGGSLTMGANFSNYVSGLVLPAGVTATRNVATAGNLNLTGNLVNSGAVYAYSTSPAVQTATFAAANITNNQGAVISTVLPTALASALGSGLVSNLHLSLAATNNIVNAGTIFSSGNLNLTAGGSITNALPTGLTGAAPIMQAYGNLNLQSPNITNAGSLISQAGNIAFNTAGASNININNTNGLIQALAGTINVRDASFAGKFDTNIFGGDILAHTMNIFSGTGIVNLSVNNLSPVLNVTTGDAYISTTVSNLNLGNLSFSGDPVIQSGNDMIILGDQKGNGPLTLSAPKGSITTDGSVLSIAGNGNVNYYALNDILLPGVKEISSSGTVSIFAQSGSVDLSDASISAQAVVPVSIGQTGIIPTSVQIGALHNVTIGGGITSPGGSVIIRAGSSITGGIIYPPSHPGNIQVGFVDLSSKANPGIGYIEIGAGNNISAGSLNGNGGFIHVYSQSIGSPGTITLTASKDPNTGNMLPVLVNNAASENLRNQCYTNIDGPGGVTINTGGFQPADGDIQARSSLVQVFSQSGSLSLVGQGKPIVIDVSALKGGNGLGGSMALLARSITTDSPVKLVANGDGTGAGGSIDVETGSALNVASDGFRATALGGSAGGSGGGVNFSAAGGITANGSAIDVSAFGNGNGGIISLSSRQVVNVLFATPYGVSGPMQISGAFNANGSGSGNGGNVYISSSNALSDIILGNGTTLSAQSGAKGGNGGIVTVQSGHNLSVDTSAVNVDARGQNGNGGSVEFDSSLGGTDGNLLINGDINVSGRGVGNGGSIVLDPIAAAIVVVPPPPPSSNTPGAITVNGNLIANAGTVGTGGTIDLEAHTGSTGSGYNKANITVGKSQQPVQVLAQGGSKSGDGGSITIKGDGNVILNTTVVSASALARGHGGTVVLDPAAALGSAVGNATVGGGGGGGGSTTPSLQLSGQVHADGVNGDGGSVSAIAPIVKLSSSTNVLISADAIGTGNGGTIAVESTDSGSNLAVGSGKGELQITAAGGTNSGNGGGIEIAAGGNLTVTANRTALNGDVINVRPGANGSGGSIILVAGFRGQSSPPLQPHYSIGDSGTVQLNGVGVINVSARNTGDGGNLAIIAPSISLPNDTVHISANAGQNGNGGAVFLDAGNASGGTFNVAGTIVALGGPNGGSGGTVSVKTEGVLKLGGLSINTSARGGNGAGGSITLGGSSNPFQTPWSPPLDLQGSFTTISNGSGTGSGGHIIVDSNEMSNIQARLTANGGSSGASGDINMLTEFSSLNGTVNATTHGSSSSSAVGGINISAHSLSLTNSTINASAIGAGNSAGRIRISTVSPGSGLMDLTGSKILANGNRGSIDLSSAGDISAPHLMIDSSTFNNAGDIAGSVTLTALGRLSIGGSVLAKGNPSGIGGLVSITTGGITIMQPALVVDTSGGTGRNVTITSTGDIASTAGLSGTLSVNARGRLGGTGDAGTIIVRAVGAISVESMTLNADAASTGNAGNIFMNGSSIKTTTGGIALQATATSNGGNAGVIKITATNGDMLLANSRLGIDASSTISSGGSIFLSALGGGSLTIGSPVKAENFNPTAIRSTSGGGITLVGSNITVNGDVNSSGSIAGGTIGMTATNDLTVNRSVIAMGDPSSLMLLFAPAGGSVTLTAGHQITINANVDASDMAPLFSKDESRPSLISINGTHPQTTSLTISAGVEIRADLYNGGDGTKVSVPSIRINSIHSIMLAGLLESLSQNYKTREIGKVKIPIPIPVSEGSGQVLITNAADLLINDPGNVQGTIFGNLIKLNSTAGQVNANLQSVTPTNNPFPLFSLIPGLAVPACFVTGNSASSFALTVGTGSLNLARPASFTPAIQANSGNIDVRLLGSGSIQVNSNIWALAGDVIIRNPSGALHVTTNNASVTGLNVTLTANTNIGANGTFHATNGSVIIKTVSSNGLISLGGKFIAEGPGTSAQPGGIVTVSVGDPPLPPLETGSNPGAINTPGNGVIFWGTLDNQQRIFGSGATVNVTDPGQVIMNAGSGQINLNGFAGSPANIRAVSYVVPSTTARKELSKGELEQIGCLHSLGILGCLNDRQHLKLVEGQLLLCPKRDTHIDCGDTVVHLRDKSCVLLERNEHGLRIYCLSDGHWGASVTVENKCDSAKCVIYGGQKLLIGHNQSSVEALRDDKVGERSVHSNEARRQVITEFSIVGLLKEHALLKELSKGTTRSDQLTRFQILKMAAALSIVQASHGLYRTYQRGPAA